MNEILTKIDDDLGFAGDGLREALKNATAVESIIIIDMIKKVARLQADVAVFINAKTDDNKK